MKILSRRPDFELYEVDPLLFSKVQSLLGGFIEDVPSLFLKYHLVPLVDNLANTDNGAFQKQVIELYAVRLPINVHQHFHNFGGLHG